jgi:SAM-dependent methyltransferase
VGREGIGWGDQHTHVHTGCERFFRPGYINFLTTNWIPALDGVEDRLRQGIEVADVGCGHGASALHMALAYPNSRLTGFDPHNRSIETAHKRAADAGVADRVKFECATAGGLTESYDLIAFFDCLHDLGDPVGALRSARAHLNDGGTVLLVEPMAGDQMEDNLNPVGAAYYALSTLLCTPQRDIAGAATGPGRPGRRGPAAPGGRPSRTATVPPGRRDPFNLVFELRADSLRRQRPLRSAVMGEQDGSAGGRPVFDLGPLVARQIDYLAASTPSGRGDTGRRRLAVDPLRGEVWEARLPRTGDHRVVVLTLNALSPRLSAVTVALITQHHGLATGLPPSLQVGWRAARSPSVTWASSHTGRLRSPGLVR